MYPMHTDYKEIIPWDTVDKMKEALAEETDWTYFSYQGRLLIVRDGILTQVYGRPMSSIDYMAITTVYGLAIDEASTAWEAAESVEDNTLDFPMVIKGCLVFANWSMTCNTISFRVVYKDTNADVDALFKAIRDYSIADNDRALAGDCNAVFCTVEKDGLVIKVSFWKPEYDS